MSEHYDLVVIGAGPAGEKGAAQAAYFGKRVCIIDRSPKPGGAAVNTSTIPSKTLRETALYFSGLRQRGLYGVEYKFKSDLTIGDLMRRERAVVEAEWRLIAENIARHGIALIHGVAHFLDPHTVEVSEYGSDEAMQITGDVFLIATGSRPLPPENFVVDGSIVVDSDTLLTLDRIPNSMVVVGGGSVGCEYACIFAALGTRVTIVNAQPRLLAHLDADVGDTLRRQMIARLGITVYNDTPVRRVAANADRAVVTIGDEARIHAECVLSSAGRMGLSAELGLERIGVRTNHRAFVLVDSKYRTSQPGIYAAGDVIGFPALASTAMEQARVAVCHAFDLKYKQAVASILPYGVWTIPEIASVGSTEEQLSACGHAYEVGRASFRANARGQIVGDLDGFVKLIFDPDDQRLLGASIVGEGATELIHIAMTCLSLGGTIDFFIQSVFTYPSLADAYKYAAYDGLQALARRDPRTPAFPMASDVSHAAAH
jgi:NAD(P) transhydrogenase